MFKVILVASGKGGTGKTSMTANVAAALAQKGHKTLVVDADVGLRNLDIVLGMSDLVVFSFADVALGIVSLEQAAAKHHDLDNLYLLTAPIELPKLDEDKITNIITEAQNQGFEYVIIDSPAGLGDEIKLFACISTQAIVVTMPDTASVRGAERVARLLEQENIMRIRIVVNRVRPSLIRQGIMGNIDDIMDEVGIPLLGVVPEDENVISYGSNGKCLIKHKKGGASTAFCNIAQRIDGVRLPIMRI
ncbi:MAG TPA: septum site-determining protein MinD [Candidatus Butyricicoccus avistercoris]|uniref:Septum site-determining protein MinD n=1 Tax=Candidatus Butyricicoccus avistercoris TaxID=2838518 RepID=A0A9D1PH91_9FIRM|nr:septum site-determining protein MinD [Candidatus Butyricicoccus avistercoris]